MTIYNAEHAAAVSWAEDFADMLLSFDRSAVGNAIKSFFRTEMAEDVKDAEEDVIYSLICVAFVKLYNRRAIDLIRPLSMEGERQLGDLLRNFNVVPTAPEEQPEELTLTEQVARDWYTLPGKEVGIKRKDPKYEAAVLRAIEQGKIK
jgi:hypothetical protein